MWFSLLQYSVFGGSRTKPSVSPGYACIRFVKKRNELKLVNLNKSFWSMTQRWLWPQKYNSHRLHYSKLKSTTIYVGGFYLEQPHIPKNQKHAESWLIVKWIRGSLWKSYSLKLRGEMCLLKWQMHLCGHCHFTPI